MGGQWERGGPFCPPFDLSLQMTRQEIKDEREFRPLSNQQADRTGSFAALCPVYVWDLQVIPFSQMAARANGTHVFIGLVKAFW